MKTTDEIWNVLSFLMFASFVLGVGGFVIGTIIENSNVQGISFMALMFSMFIVFVACAAGGQQTRPPGRRIPPWSES